MAKEKEVIYEIQGMKSFLKVKMDWAGIGKIHLSFVSHTGRDNGCKQLNFIEGALDVEGAFGALYFAEAILNGHMGRKRVNSLKKAQESGSKYPEPLFTYNGGKPAKNGNPCLWRQIQLSPGQKADYVLQALEAEGVENKMGGFSKKEGATVTRISVSASAEELMAMASAIRMNWTVYLVHNPPVYSNRPQVDDMAMVDDEPMAQAPAAPAPVQTPVQAPAPALPDYVYSIYDSFGSAIRVALTPDMALKALQDNIVRLKKEGGWARKDNTEYEEAKAKILSGDLGFSTVRLYSGNETCSVYVTTCEFLK